MDGTDVVSPLATLIDGLKAITAKLEAVAGEPAPTPTETPTQTEPTPAEKVWEDLEPGLKWGIENGQINPANLSADVQALVAELGKAPVESDTTQEAPPVQ